MHRPEGDGRLAMVITRFLLAALLAALVALAGCRSDPRIALLERELREQEDEIYRLQAELEEYDEALCQADARRVALEDALCEREKPARSAPAADAMAPTLRAPANGPAHSMPEPPAAKPAPPTEIPPPRPRTPVPLPPSPGSRPASPPEVGGSIEEIDPSALQPPKVELPTRGQSQPPPTLQLPMKSGDDPRKSAVDGPRFEPVAQATPLPAAQTPQVPNTEVSQIVLERGGSGGFDVDHQPGDEGIAVLVQPRDAAGTPVEAPAAISVTVVDPAIQGDAATIGRWDFTAAEVGRSFRSGAELQGHQLEMLWPAGLPRHGDLQVQIEYTTDDGRTLQTDGWITVALPGRQSTRWVPVAPRSSEPPQVADEPQRTRDSAVQPASAIEPASSERPSWSPDR